MFNALHVYLTDVRTAIRLRQYKYALPTFIFTHLYK